MRSIFAAGFLAYFGLTAYCSAAEWRFRVFYKDWHPIADFANNECGSRDSSGLVGATKVYIGADNYT